MAKKTNDKKTTYKKNSSKNNIKKTNTTKKNTITKSTTNKLEKNNDKNTGLDSDESPFKLFNFKRNKKNKMPVFIRIIVYIFTCFSYLRKQKLKYRDYDKKAYSTKCNFITLSIVAMVCIFVYNGKSLFYAYPLITSVLLFMKFSKGINSGQENKHHDLKLYRKILRANIILITLVFVTNYENLWFLDFSSILIFIVPLMISKIGIGIPFKRFLRLGRQ